MQNVELSVGRQGRIVIPAALRRQLAIQPGSRLLARVEDGRLVMETKKQLWQSIHAACDVIPDSASLSDELIAERRAQAEKENA